MGKLKDKVLNWWSDGVDYKEFLALLIIGIFAYLVYFACEKMMGVGLVELDIEFLKIISTNLIIVLAFYFGGGSAEKIIQSLFSSKVKNQNENTGGGNNEIQNYR